MSYIIQRKDSDVIQAQKHWLLVYGRRKVGKTFLLRDLCKFKNYYTVRSDLSIMSDKGAIPMADFAEEIKNLLLENRTVVVDEFQRLNTTLFEDISLLHPKGKLILSGSSFRIIKKIFEPKSALLGFFTPLRVEFILPSDIVSALSKELKPEEVIELSAFLREPWAIPLYNNKKIIEFVYELVTNSRYIITALIGEIFTEEERELTKKYEAIINLVGSGIWNTRELTSILYSRKLIPDPSPTHVIQYLKNLEEMGLLESIKLHRSKGRYYRLVSPIMNIYYYLESKYDLSSRPVSFEELEPTLQKLINLEIQNFIADLFSELYEGRKEYFVSAEKEVDFIITKRNKTEIIGEVKWKKIDKEDVGRFKKNSERFYGKKILVCKGGITDNDMEIMVPDALVLLVKEKSRNKKMRRL